MLKSFTRNYKDNSTEAGFRFTFYCDLCQKGHETSFSEFQTYKRGNLLRKIGKRVSTLCNSLFGSRLELNPEWDIDIRMERFQGMSLEWHKEHHASFERAQNEAKHYFNRCNKCHRWVCDGDFNEEEGLCTVCAPR